MLFIDEIHRLNPAVEEILYPAMEDFQLDLIIGQGPAARSVKIDLARFTLVGATTRAGLLTTPLRDRFGIPIRLNFYTVPELESIVRRGARVFDIGIAPDGANEIARRARGTPRIAGRLLRRVRDFALVDGAETITRAIADSALKLLDVDEIGLDGMDRRYLDIIALSFGGGPVGVETIAAALSEPRDAIEDIIEPYLIQLGFLQTDTARPSPDAARVPAPGAQGTQGLERANRPFRRRGGGGPMSLEPHRFTVRVYYEDTDFSGVVYHANYLRYLERGRTEMLRDAGDRPGGTLRGRRSGILRLRGRRDGDRLPQARPHGRCPGRRNRDPLDRRSDAAAAAGLAARRRSARRGHGQDRDPLRRAGGTVASRDCGKIESVNSGTH